MVKMFSSRNEELMIKFLLKSYKNNGQEILTFYFDNGYIITGIINVFYETDNGLELDESEYIEYYACAITICDIIAKNNKISGLQIGKLLEVGYRNIPTKITSKDGRILWKINDFQ